MTYNKKLNEDFFDEINNDEMTSDNAFDQLSSKPEKKNIFDINNPDPNFKYVIFRTRLDTYGEMTFNPKDIYNRLRKIYNAVDVHYNDVCSDFVISIFNGKKSYHTYAKDNTEVSLEEFSSNFNEKLKKGEWILTVCIVRNLNDDVPSLKRFYGLIDMFVKFIVHVHYSLVSIEYGMDLYYVNNQLEYKNIQKYMNDLNNIYRMMYDVEKPELKIKTVKPNFEYKGPAHLSDKSKKRMKDFKYGDVLYCDEYGLNGDGSGEAVAICMKTKSEKDEARFISLKYASTDHPDTGTDDTSYIPFCMNGIDLTYITTQEEYYYYLNDSDNFIENNWNTGHLAYVHDSIDYIYAPIIVASYRYHTPGTKKGQWFCPNDKDYEECFVNIRGSIQKIDKTLESLGKKGLYEFGYITLNQEENKKNKFYVFYLQNGKIFRRVYPSSMKSVLVRPFIWVSD